LSDASDLTLKVDYKKIIKPCKTRWNSLFMAIKSILCMQDALNVLRENLDPLFLVKELGKTDTIIPSNIQFTVLEQVCEVLEPVAVLSTALETSKVSIHTLVVELYNLQKKLKRWLWLPLMAMTSRETSSSPLKKGSLTAGP